MFLPEPDGILDTADDVENTKADPVHTGPFATLLPLVIRDNPATVGPDTNYLQYAETGSIGYLLKAGQLGVGQVR